MAKCRANGEGTLRKRKGGRGEGRYTVGRDLETGKAICKNALGKARTKVKPKQATEEAIGWMRPTRQSVVPFPSWSTKR